MTITSSIGTTQVPAPRSSTAPGTARAEVIDIRDDWTRFAACRDTDPDQLFVTGAAQHEAKLVCKGCPVRAHCLADALDNRVEIGVWGGMTERERRALLRRRPEVTSWAALLTDARRDWTRTA
ncbi:MAG TPA: WhiB family transcriptional regulator [Mycobacteriales bacterium]|nr:WhiB family transcriptional regulator [Mycobacteriales bacterium]